MNKDDVNKLLNTIDDALSQDYRKIARRAPRRLGNVKTARRYTDPLALDLDGDGIELTRLSGETSVKFDADGDGVRTATAWIASDDALLVLDRNGNGRIDDGSELFGDQTHLANGQLAADGIAALAELDSNGDGVFSALDARYGDVRLWQDRNQDGVSQADELIRLADAGVASISLTATSPNTSLTDAVLEREGTWTATDGATHKTGSFDFAQDSYWTDALSGGNNLATALSLNACPYLAISFFRYHPRVSNSIEATTILTQRVCKAVDLAPGVNPGRYQRINQKRFAARMERTPQKHTSLKG